MFVKHLMAFACAKNKLLQFIGLVSSLVVVKHIAILALQSVCKLDKTERKIEVQSPNELSPHYGI